MVASDWQGFDVARDAFVDVDGIPASLRAKVSIRVASGSRLVIKGVTALHSQLVVSMSTECVLEVDAGQVFSGPVTFMMNEPSAISVGEGCLWGQTRLWSSDMHSIIDVSTGLRINRARGISIGQRVWFGDGSLVLKGSSIGNDCVVGAGSILAGGDYPSNSLIVGNPATVRRSGIAWSPALL